MRMWQLSNFTPVPVIAGFERDAQGHSHYVVTISASFRIDAAGRAWFDADQPPPLQSPQFLENDPEGLLTADADQGLPHPGIDILLAADAMLTPTEPRRRLTLRLAGMQRRVVLMTGLGDAALLGVGRKDRRPVLRPDIGPLSIKLRRVVRHREMDLQDRAVAHHGGIERDLDDFGMADIPLGCEVHRWWGLPTADYQRPALPHIERWFAALKARPAAKGVLDLAVE